MYVGESRCVIDAVVVNGGGATLVESALIMPILLLFVFGIFEFGFAFRDYLAVSNIVRDAAREASVACNAADADYRIL